MRTMFQRRFQGWWLGRPGTQITFVSNEEDINKTGVRVVSRQLEGDATATVRLIRGDGRVPGSFTEIEKVENVHPLAIESVAWDLLVKAEAL